MVIVGLLVMLCSALLVTTVVISIYGFAIGDPLDSFDQTIALAFAIASLAFLWIAFRARRRVLAGGNPVELMAGVARAVPILSTVGALSGAILCGWMIVAHGHALDRVAESLCREVIGYGQHEERVPSCVPLARKCRRETHAENEKWASHRESPDRPEAVCVRKALGLPPPDGKSN